MIQLVAGGQVNPPLTVGFEPRLVKFGCIVGFQFGAETGFSGIAGAGGPNLGRHSQRSE